MNKISKKIVALVTMAAFVLTLVPAAAFAASTTTSVKVNSDSQELTIAQNGEVTATVDVTVGTGDAGDNLVLWVEKDGSFYRNAKFALKDGNLLDATGVWVDRAIMNAPTAGDYKVEITFNEAGTYTVCAGVSVGNAANNPSELNVVKIAEEDATINVEAEAADVDTLSISNASQVAADNNKEWNATNAIKPNNTATQTHTITAYENGYTVAGQDVKVTTSSKNISVTAKNMDNKAFDGNVATTDENGQFQISYTVAKAGNYKIYLTAENGFKVTLNVTTTDIDNYVADIEAEKIDQILDIDALNNSANAVLLSNAVQFVLTDNNGNKLEDAAVVANEPAAWDPTIENATEKADYVKVLSAPKAFKGTATDFTLAWDSNEEVYTLKYAQGAPALVKGEYTIRVALKETGKYADVTFTVGEYGTTQSIKIIAPDEVVAGDNFKGKVVGVDENGIEKVLDKDSYALSVSGKAVGAKEETVPSGYSFEYGTLPDIFGDVLEVVGTKINVLAISEDLGKMATAEVTVVAEPNVAGLNFDSENGVADKDNTVVATVVDDNNNVVKSANGAVYAYVADQSNKDANVEVKPLAANAQDGKAKISIYSDVETTVDVVVAITDDNGTIYADTLKYTIGEADVNADKIVAMTIGSTDMIVNNELVNGDAAPYVADGRTMVPIRALTETFGAEVNYDNDAKTVTIVDGDTTVVMTIGETTYTVNGEEQTMDVAPVIGSSDRTYVPVRFVAEALGYKVTPLYAADGTTASVVFQK